MKRGERGRASGRKRGEEEEDEGEEGRQEWTRAGGI